MPYFLILLTVCSTITLSLECFLLYFFSSFGSSLFFFFLNGGTYFTGWDAAGEVIAVGSDCTLFQKGDAVYYAGSISRPGTNCEFHLVDERIVGRKPKSLSFEEAAAMPLTTITAWEALYDRLGLYHRERKTTLPEISTSDNGDKNKTSCYRLHCIFDSYVIGEDPSKKCIDSTVNLRANGGNTGNAISIGANTTGIFTDAADTYTAAATDAMNYQIVMGSTGTSWWVNWYMIGWVM
jgi:hypothetical protein